MNASTRSRSLGFGALAILLALAGAAQAGTPAEKCRDTLLKESGKHIKAQTKTLTKCNDSILKGKDGFNGMQGPDCRDTLGKTQEKLDKAESKFKAAIDKGCGGADKDCDTADDIDIDDPVVGWGASGSFGGVCPDFEQKGCFNPVQHCGGDDSDGLGITDCLLCTNDATIEQVLELLYGDLNPAPFGTSDEVNKCQQALVKVSAKHALAKSKTLGKCWASLNKGTAGFNSSDALGCIDPTGKTGDKIDKSESKKIAGICKKCGGPDDKACDQNIATLQGTAVNTAGTGGDLDPQAQIGFGDECPPVTLPYPPNTDCGTLDNLPSGSQDDVIENMEELVRCIDCVIEFKIDCADRTAVPNHEALPDECNTCIEDTDGDACPTVVQVTADGPNTNLDTGWTGLSHDFDVPTNGRLTLGVSNCDGATRPTCGECDLTGPLANAGGAQFNNHRCQLDNSITCNADSDCGANAPCVFYFGVGLPLSSGGVPICVTNEVQGAVTGTANIETAESAATIDLISRVHVGVSDERPCPNCVDGLCTAGPRANLPCLENSQSSIFGPLSFDCPPSGVIGTLPIKLTPATGLQTVTLAAGSPGCTGGGFTTKKCFCSTCDVAGVVPCMSDAECVLAGGTTCGGKRCLPPSTNLGAPCTLSTDCTGVGAQCGVPGEATRSNQCLDTICTSNPGDTDSVDEGICNAGPFDLLCSIERFRSCLSDAQCQPPGCPNCVPGQTCISRTRECYDDNGMVGGSVSVAGAGAAACGNIAKPKLGSLFCIPPTESPSVNSTAGTPGLGRLTLPTITIFDP